MSFDTKLLSFLNKKYKKKLSLKDKLFNNLELDSFETMSLIFEIEKKYKKKYKINLSQNYTNINIQKFSKLFK